MPSLNTAIVKGLGIVLPSLEEQRAIASDGHRMRVYVPYGTEWYGYLVRRLAERPANLSLLARALVSKG